MTKLTYQIPGRSRFPFLRNILHKILIFLQGDTNYSNILFIKSIVRGWQTGQHFINFKIVIHKSRIM